MYKSNVFEVRSIEEFSNWLSLWKTEDKNEIYFSVIPATNLVQVKANFFPEFRYAMAYEIEYQGPVFRRFDEDIIDYLTEKTEMKWMGA